MPRRYVSRRKRPYRRRRNRLYRTKRRSGVTSLSLRRGVGMPDRFTTVLQYSDRLTLDTASGGSQVFTVYRANSLFDPQFAVGGQQPNYYDQFVAMYAHYMVWGSKIEVVALNAQGPGTQANPHTADLLCVTPTRSSTPSSDVGLAIEQPRAKWRMIGDQSKAYRIVNSARTKQMLPFRNSQQFALTNANPEDVWYWIVQCNSSNGTDECILDIVVKITYYCTFYERTQQPRS